MSQRRNRLGRGRSKDPRAPSRAPARARPRASRAGLALATVALAAIALAGTARWWRKPAAPRPAPPHPAEAMDIQRAWSTAVDLGRSGRHREAIPYYRHILGQIEDWEVHHNLSAALQNEALEVRTHLDRIEPALRSSFERQEAMREAFVELARSESGRQSPAERAFLIRQRARLYLTWGLPVDALRETRLADDFAIVPQNDSLRRQILSDLVVR